MRFIVPQFIERESKLIGPLTFRQFLYVGSAGFICFIIYFSFPFNVFLLSCFVFGGIALAFAFLEINGAPFATFLWNFFKYSLSPKTYFWGKKGQDPNKISLEEDTEETNLSLEGKSNLKNKRTKVEIRS